MGDGEGGRAVGGGGVGGGGGVVGANNVLTLSLPL